MTWKQIPGVLKKAYINFKSKYPLRLAAATAFFATFALPPILLIIIDTFGIFYNAEAMKKGVFNQLAGVLSKESSIKLSGIFDRFQQLAQNWLITLHRIITSVIY